jgi:hypothetical protein
MWLRIRSVSSNILKCPVLKHGCEAVADAPFALPFGIPDGFIAAANVTLGIFLRRGFIGLEPLRRPTALRLDRVGDASFPRYASYLAWRG